MGCKVLVTGSAGFIGMHTVVALASKGFEIIGLDNLNTYYSVDLKLARLREQGINTNTIQYNRLISGKQNIGFIQLDLTDSHLLEQLFKEHQFQYVIHLAAQAGVRYSIENPYAYIDSNIKGFMDILECSRKYQVKHLIYASSSSVYGMNKNVPFREDDQTDEQVSLYAATKKANEAMAHSFASVHKLPLTGLRFFTVYGPFGRPDMALFKFTKSILNDEPIDVYNHGDLHRDFTYIDDIVEGILELTDSPPKAEIPYQMFNIGRGEPVALMDFIKCIESCTEKKALLNRLPMQKGDVSKTFASTEKLFKETSYSPKIDLEQGVANFVKWYKGFYC